MAELIVNTRRPVVDLGTKSGAVTLDSAKAECYALSTSGNVVVNVTGTSVVALVVTNGGGHTVTHDGETLTVDTAVGARTFVEFWPDGSDRRVIYPGASAPGDVIPWEDVTQYVDQRTTPSTVDLAALITN